MNTLSLLLVAYFHFMNILYEILEHQNIIFLLTDYFFMDLFKIFSDINDCTPNACENNGLCVDAVNKFTCDCDGTGHKGDNCETSEQIVS